MTYSTDNAVDASAKQNIAGLEFQQPIDPEHGVIYNPEACRFVARLLAELGPMRKSLLYNHKQNLQQLRQQQNIDKPQLDFLKQTQVVRESDWQIPPLSDDLADRRCELIAPAYDAKLIRNAINSQAQTLMADFEDGCYPAWVNYAQGQLVLRQVCHGEIGQADAFATQLICRIRSLGDSDSDIYYSGLPASAAIVDAGFYCFHNAKVLLERGRTPQLYIAKLASYEEAAWWAELIRLMEMGLKLPPGSIKVSVIIESLTAALEVDEIIYALKNNITALNFGRWDFIRSYADYLYPQKHLPNRDALNLEQDVINDFSRLLVKTCHRRGVLALAGMNTLFWDRRSQTQAQDALYQQWLADKHLEVTNGYDGTWVAHPSLINQALRLFVKPNQMDKDWRNYQVNPQRLDLGFSGRASESGLKANVAVSLLYLNALLSKQAAIVVEQQVEDFSSASLAWLSLWQWIEQGLELSSGQEVTLDWVRELIGQMSYQLCAQGFDAKQLQKAGVILDQLLVERQQPLFSLTQMVARIHAAN